MACSHIAILIYTEGWGKASEPVHGQTVNVKNTTSTCMHGCVIVAVLLTHWGGLWGGFSKRIWEPPLFLLQDKKKTSSICKVPFIRSTCCRAVESLLLVDGSVLARHNSTFIQGGDWGTRKWSRLWAGDGEIGDKLRSWEPVSSVHKENQWEWQKKRKEKEGAAKREWNAKETVEEKC